MNNRYSELYQLIAAMSEEECTTLEQRYSSRKEKPKHLQLYKAIKTQISENTEPNDAHERRLAEELHSKDLRSLLRDTQEKILDFLDEYLATQASPRKEVRRLLDRTEYCQQRGLAFAAQEAWQQAHQLAVQYQLYDEYPRLYRLRITYGFRFDAGALREDIRGFAEMAFQIGASLQNNAQSPAVFGNVQEVVHTLRNHYQQEYKDLIQHLQKAQHQALQEEIINALGRILQANIKDALEGQGSHKLAAQGSNEFYEDWFYRLLFLQNRLAKHDQQYFHKVYHRKLKHFKDTPQHFLPPDSQPEGADEQAIRSHTFDNAWVKAWRILENLELIYTSFNSGYYERVQVAINEIRQYALTHDAPIKYSALGYFLARKIMHWETLCGLQENNYQEKVQNIVKTMPQDLCLFSQEQVPDLLLRYEMNVILLRFLSCYGNQQALERERLQEDLKQFEGSKILKKNPHYEADIRLMHAYIGLYSSDADLDNELRRLKSFLEKHNLIEGFHGKYYTMLRKAYHRNKSGDKPQSIVQIYEKYKNELLNTRASHNPFHHALCVIFELANT